MQLTTLHDTLSGCYLQKSIECKGSCQTLEILCLLQANSVATLLTMEANVVLSHRA